MATWELVWLVDWTQELLAYGEPDLLSDGELDVMADQWRISVLLLKNGFHGKQQLEVMLLPFDSVTKL